MRKRERERKEKERDGEREKGRESKRYAIKTFIDRQS